MSDAFLQHKLEHQPTGSLAATRIAFQRNSPDLVEGREVYFPVVHPLKVMRRNKCRLAPFEFRYSQRHRSELYGALLTSRNDGECLIAHDHPRCPAEYRSR